MSELGRLTEFIHEWDERLERENQASLRVDRAATRALILVCAGGALFLAAALYGLSVWFF